MKEENIKSEYQRKVDKSLIPTCNIMGVNIAAINMNWLLKYIDENLSDIKGDYICVSNVHTTVTSYEDAAYCAVQNGGLMAIPDGGPLSSVGRKRGYSDMDRTTGPSLMGEIFKISAEKGYRHYFYGSTEETLKLLEEKLQANYPGIQIAGMYSPPFRPLTEEEDKNIIENVKSPKRIIWAYDELQNLSTVEMPSLEEMFGVDADGNLKINIENKENEPKRDITLPVCYRNPPWMLALAHSLGFGIYRNSIVQMFDDPSMWEDIGYTVKGGSLKVGNMVTLSRNNAATPEYFEELLDKKDSVKEVTFATIEQQYSWIAQEIRKNIEHDELDPDDILVVFPNTYSAKSEYKELEKFFKAVGIKSILAGVDTNRDTFRVNNCVTCANVYRAKGNEAPMVYIANSEYCADGAELSKLRNILFTSITRSRAWVRICGVGEEMQQIQREYEQCADNDYNLCFKVPTPKELEAARKLNRERTSTEKKILKTSKDNINELIDNLENGTVDLELLPELDKLMEVLKKGNRDEKD